MSLQLHPLDLVRTRAGKRLSCGPNGVYFDGDYAFIERKVSDGHLFYQVVNLDKINRTLFNGLGTELDILSYFQMLSRVAKLMTDGKWALAQITILHMRLPELLDNDELDRLQKADDLIRFNPNHKPAGPGGGEFTTAGSAGQLSFDQIVSLVKQNNRSDKFSDEAIISIIYRESRFNSKAVNKNAVGLMQIKPISLLDVNLRSGSIQKYTPEDRYNPAKNIQIGTHLLDLKMRLYPHDADGALMAFGTGKAAYARAVRAGELGLKSKPSDPMAVLARVHGTR